MKNILIEDKILKKASHFYKELLVITLVMLIGMELLKEKVLDFYERWEFKTMSVMEIYVLAHITLVIMVENS